MSGFASRKHEQVYNTVLAKLLALLCERLGTFTVGEADRTWAKKIWKIYRLQTHLERSKQLRPYFSECLQDFALSLKQTFNVSLK